jgi:hypothetical protein
LPRKIHIRVGIVIAIARITCVIFRDFTRPKVSRVSAAWCRLPM